ncbi:MAG: phosphodiesterase [Pseudomonadota bacterium]
MPRIAQLTDLHLRPPGVLTLGAIDADAYATAAIDAVIAKHDDLDAVMVTGDIADLGEEDAYTRAAMLLSRFAIPVFVVPGNHDMTHRLRDAFITWPGVSDAPVPEKLCYSADLGSVRVVMLDTAVNRDNQMVPSGTLGTAQLEWLDAVLDHPGDTIIGMHHPPFQVGIGFMDEISLSDADAFGAVVAKHANVARIVCGHVHRTIVGTVGGVTTMAIPGVAHQVKLALSAVAVPQLVMEPPAYGIHLAAGGAVVSHVGYVDNFGGPQTFSEMAAKAEPAR